MFKLRPYQEECCLAFLQHGRKTKIGNKLDEVSKVFLKQIKGRGVLPTSAGKTVIYGQMLAWKTQSTLNTKIHLILAPRIGLLNQIIKEVRNVAGQNYVALAFHSGQAEPEYHKVKWTEKSTTNIQTVLDEIERAKTLGKDLTLFSTYHSMDKLLDIDFDLTIADESQYLISKAWFETYDKIKANQKFSFTATEKHNTVGSRGNNNTDVFGDIVYQMTPKQLVDLGYAVPPRLHVMTASTNNSDKSKIDELIQFAVTQHRLTTDKAFLKKYENKMLYDEEEDIEDNQPMMAHSKILYACNGTEIVKTVSQNVTDFKKVLPKHKIFCIVSNSKYGATIDGIKVSRGEFMKELRECDDALIFHYDILSEGIDIDGITGVVIDRNMNLAKLIQTIGRAVRLWKQNPMAKRWAWVSVSVLNDNDDTKSWVKDVVSQLKEAGYDITFESILFTDEDNAGINDDEDDVWPPQPIQKAKKVLSDVVHEVEQVDKWNKLNNVNLHSNDVLDKITKLIYNIGE